MKRIFLFTLTFVSFLTNAQTLFELSGFAGTSISDSLIETNTNYFTNSENVATPSNLTFLYDGDTSFFHYTVGSIADGVGSGGTDDTHDTLELDLAIASWIQTDGATYTISNKHGTYTHENISGVTNNYNSFKFVEGESDTVMIIVTAGTLAMDKLRITSITNNVITSIVDPLSSSKTIISNPVINEKLSIDLNGLRASFELVSLEGNILKEIEVEGSKEVNLNGLNSGLYILRDRNTNNYRKIMIK